MTNFDVDDDDYYGNANIFKNKTQNSSIMYEGVWKRTATN